MEVVSLIGKQCTENLDFLFKYFCSCAYVHSSPPESFLQTPLSTIFLTVHPLIVGNVFVDRLIGHPLISDHDGSLLFLRSIIGHVNKIFFCTHAKTSCFVQKSIESKKHCQLHPT